VAVVFETVDAFGGELTTAKRTISGANPAVLAAKPECGGLAGTLPSTASTPGFSCAGNKAF
jgi:hypothetical protein